MIADDHWAALCPAGSDALGIISKLDIRISLSRLCMRFYADAVSWKFQSPSFRPNQLSGVVDEVDTLHCSTLLRSCTVVVNRRLHGTQPVELWEFGESRVEGQARGVQNCSERALHAVIQSEACIPAFSAERGR